MKNAVYEMKNKRNGFLKQAQEAHAAKDKAAYDAAMTEVRKLNEEIEQAEALLAEQGRFDEGNVGMMNLHMAQAQKKEEDLTKSKLDLLRSGNEYATAFALALRSGASIENGRSREKLRPLYDALTESGGTPEGSDGGFLVPIDFDNMIHEVQRALSPLESEFELENVTTLTGWRALDTAPSAGFTLVDEMDEVAEDDQPKFSKVEYKVDMYGLIVPVSRELMQDNTVNLMRYLARWFGKKAVITKNKLLLSLLSGLTATAIAEGEEIKQLKRALNVKLDPMISANAVIMTNQSGFSVLDELEDAEGKGLLQPDFREPTKFRALGRRVVVVPNRFLANPTSATAPVYIGDMKQYGTLFQRMPFEFASTDIGGNAWKTVSTETRGLIRLDAQKIDTEAAIALTLPIID